MISINKVLIVGTLAGPPAVRTNKGKLEMVGLSIFTERRHKETGSNAIFETKEYHRVVVSQGRHITFAAGLEEGSQLYIEGELFTNFWRDELYNWQSLTKVIIWRDSDQIYLIGEDRNDTSLPSKEVLAATEGRALFEMPDVA